MKKLLSILSLILISILFTGCNKERSSTIYAFNTFIEITLYDGSDEDLQKIEDIYYKYNKLCDNYQAYTGINNVYTINNSNDYIEVEEDLIDLLRYCLEMETKLGGIFKTLSGNLTLLWKEAIANEVVLDDETINIELSKINNSQILFNNNSVKIVGDAEIDLGAVAKGYATEKVQEYLISQNIKNYLLNAGLSSLCLGIKPNKNDFKVGIKGCSNKILNIHNNTIGTSSISEQMVVIDENTYHHILDMRTGYPQNYYDTLCVIGNSCALTDVLSTSCFSLKVAELANICEQYNVDIIAIKNNEIVYESNGMINYE